jgi:putative transposase
MPGDRSFAFLRARTRGQRRRRALIRTLKENLLWVGTFDTIEDLRAALITFARHHSETWLVAGHGYRTPAQVRADQCRLDQNAMADLKLAA